MLNGAIGGGNTNDSIYSVVTTVTGWGLTTTTGGLTDGLTGGLIGIVPPDRTPCSHCGVCKQCEPCLCCNHCRICGRPTGYSQLPQLLQPWVPSIYPYPGPNTFPTVPGLPDPLWTPISGSGTAVTTVTAVSS